MKDIWGQEYSTVYTASLGFIAHISNKAEAETIPSLFYISTLLFFSYLITDAAGSCRN